MKENENLIHEMQFYAFSSPIELFMLCRRLLSAEAKPSGNSGENHLEEAPSTKEPIEVFHVGYRFFMAYRGIAPIWVCDYCTRLSCLEGARAYEYREHVGLTRAQLAELASLLAF